MTFEDLRYDQFRFKASHNTIERARDLRRWSIEDQLSGSGDVIEPVLGLEFDIHKVEGKNEYHVKHDRGDEGILLRDALEKVEAWSSARQDPGHPVVTIVLDLKNQPDSDEEFCDQLDALLLEVFSVDRIYTPGQVMGNEPDVLRGAKSRGWATFRELRGKVLFCLSGAARRGHFYANHNPRERLAFADFDVGSREPMETGNQPFANVFVDHQTAADHLRRWTRSSGFVVRAYNLVARDAWDVCVETGVNVLSTDVLDDSTFVVSGLGYSPLGDGLRQVPRNLAFDKARSGHEFRNWSRTVRFKPSRYTEPRSEGEIQEIVRQAGTRTGPLRTQGAGHSFSQILTTRGTLLSLDDMNGSYEVDGDRVTVPAGMRLKDLIPLLKQDGLALANIGSVTQQSIAGAVSTGTHGTGLRYRSMPTHVQGVRLVDGRGTIRSIGEGDGDVLGAARLSLGTMGVLTAVTLGCVPYYEVDYHVYICDLHEGFDRLHSLAKEHERVLMWWMVPLLPRDKAIIITKNKRGTGPESLDGVDDVADDVERRLNLPQTSTLSWQPERLGTVLEPHYRQGGCRRVLRRSGGYEDMLTIPLLPVFHREMEYAVPIDKGGTALRALDAIFAEGSVKLDLPCEVRYVAGDDDLLSPTQGEDVCYIGVAELENATEVFEQVEPVFRDLGGRPHWGKHFNLTRSQVEGMYGSNHERFVEIRREFDPDGLFLNSLLRRLFE